MTSKLAVLVSGSYRNFDEVWKENLPIIENLGVPFEVIFHTWRDNPDLKGNILELEFKNRFYWSIHPKRYKAFRKNISAEFLNKNFNFSKIFVDEFPEKQLSEKYNLGNSISNIRYRQLLNSAAMYFGIDKCRIELVKDNSFTHFLRLRTDFLLDPSRTKEIFQHDLTFFGQLLPTPEGPIGDQCFGGRIDTSLKILDLLETVLEITHSSSWDTSKSMVLAEDVIRKRLMPFRKKWNILYLEGCGLIKRPDLIRLTFDPRVFKDIFLHNVVRLKSVLILAFRKIQ